MQNSLNLSVPFSINIFVSYSAQEDFLFPGRFHTEEGKQSASLLEENVGYTNRKEEHPLFYCVCVKLTAGVCAGCQKILAACDVSKPCIAYSIPSIYMYTVDFKSTQLREYTYKLR